MGGIEKEQIFQEMSFKENNDKSQSQPEQALQWVLMEARDHDDDHVNDFESDFIETDSEDENEYIESSSSSEMVEDGSSLSSSSSSSHGPLYELSELMAQLPIKRGLSKNYQGKSQSFASLASVKSLEDLAKKGKYSYGSRRSVKQCKSYGGVLDGQSQSQILRPKATIAKKSCSSSRSSLFSSLGKMSSFVESCRPTTISLQKHF